MSEPLVLRQETLRARDKMCLYYLLIEVLLSHWGEVGQQHSFQGFGRLIPTKRQSLHSAVPVQSIPFSASDATTWPRAHENENPFRLRWVRGPAPRWIRPEWKRPIISLIGTWRWHAEEPWPNRKTHQLGQDRNCATPRPSVFLFMVAHTLLNKERLPAFVTTVASPTLSRPSSKS